MEHATVRTDQMKLVVVSLKSFFPALFLGQREQNSSYPFA